MSERRTLIVVWDEQVQASLARLVEQLPWARNRGLRFLCLDGDVQAVVTQAREQSPDCPLGYVAHDETAVLAALAAGADEAGVVAVDDPAQLAAFVARLEVRAAMRAETHKLHASFAHSEKLTALGTLVAGVGHEINNPLSAVMLSIDAARRRLLPALDAAWELSRAARDQVPLPEASVALLLDLAEREKTRSTAQLLDDMNAATDAIASIVRDLRIFARSDEHEPLELIDVGELIDHALRLSGRDVIKHGVLERDYQAPLPTLALPRSRITQVLVNVLVNAGHAVAEIERPMHRIRVSARADEEFVAIAVSDTGPGIPPESIERIFDPFFTTKRQELGTGLGLSISRAILRKLGGELTVESVYNEGATFVCLLPIPEPSTLRAAWRRTSAAPTSEPPPSSTILVVDGDPHMLRAYARILSGEHRLIVARDACEAIELLESGSEANVVLSELDFPELDGVGFHRWLLEHRPQLAEAFVVITAGGTNAEQRAFLESSGPTVLYKPVRADTVRDAIGVALAKAKHATL